MFGVGNCFDVGRSLAVGWDDWTVQFRAGGGWGGYEGYEDILIVQQLLISRVTVRLRIIPRGNLPTSAAPLTVEHQTRGRSPGLGWELLTSPADWGCAGGVDHQPVPAPESNTRIKSIIQICCALNAIKTQLKAPKATSSALSCVFMTWERFRDQHLWSSSEPVWLIWWKYCLSEWSGLYPAPWVLRYSLSFLRVTTLAPVTPSPARITDWFGLQGADVRKLGEGGVVLSHWSRSLQILCSDWLGSWYCWRKLMHRKTRVHHSRREGGRKIQSLYSKILQLTSVRIALNFYIEKDMEKLGLKSVKFCCFFIIQTFPYRPDFCVLNICGPDIVDPGSLHGQLPLCSGVSNVCGIRF